MVKGGERIAIGVSGGKDSVTVLRMLSRVFPKGVELFGVCIDEGIPGYRDKAIAVAKPHFEETGVPFEVLSLKRAFGHSMREVAAQLDADRAEGKRAPAPCTYCGVFRRQLLNRFARENRFDKLATGHNLDDEAQNVLMNMGSANTAQLVRTAPASAGGAGMVPRIKPLFFTPEREVVWHAGFQKWGTYSDTCCPFCHRAKRNAFRSALDLLEEKQPGTAHALVSAAQKIREGHVHREPVRTCVSCGAPSAGDVCMACARVGELEERMRGKKAVKTGKVEKAKR